MPRPTYTPLPAAPSIGSPNFATEADAFLGALPTHATYLETLADWLQNDFYAELIDGTAAAPAITWASDPNTGIFRPGADIIGFSTNSTERLRINNTGVSVTGELSTTGNLTVDKVEAANDEYNVHIKSFRPNIVLEDISGTTTDAQIQMDSGILTIGGGDATVPGPLVTKVPFSIDLDQGFVGVGNTSPQTKFHVAGGEARFDDHLSVQANVPNIYLDETDTTTSSRFLVSNSILYLQAGEAAGGRSVGGGKIVQSGWGGVDLTEFKVISADAIFESNGTPRLEVYGGTVRVGNPQTGTPGVGGGGNIDGISLATSGQYYGSRTGIAMSINREGSNGDIQQFRRSGTVVGTVSVTGSATAYNTSSDYRLKENLAPVEHATQIIEWLNPTFFTFKGDGDWMDGFLAHEVQLLIPGAVTGEKDAVDEDGNPVYQGIDHSRLVPYLVKALQETNARVRELEDKVALMDALELRIAALEAK